jgi:hypothetical protein
MQDTPDIDIDQHVEQLLAQHRKIAVIWCTDDVMELRPDLSEDQAWEVLQLAMDKHDASYGIDWTTLEIFAEVLYPEAINNQQQGD